MVATAIIKRDGREVPYNRRFIERAIMLAGLYKVEAERVAKIVESKLHDRITVEDIQDIVEVTLMNNGFPEIAKKYILYRDKRTRLRNIESKALDIIKDTDESIKGDNSNKDTRRANVTREYFAGIVSKQLSKDLLLDSDIVEAHNIGRIHFHDMDYFAQRIPNCCLVNLFDILWNSTVINNIKITRPHSFKNACNIACQIAALVASQQYGGQTISLAHLAPFVDISRKEIRKRIKATLEGTNTPISVLQKLVNSELSKEIKGGVQTITYQLLTMSTSNGQTPFVSLAMDINEPFRDSCAFKGVFSYSQMKIIQKDLATLIEEVLLQRKKGLPDVNGLPVTQAFPKLLYFTDENNIKEGSKYFFLTKLAVQCSAKRMNPDYISAKVMLENKGDVYPCMGCRSFLTPDPINHRYYGRNNQGVVTINLPYVAMYSIFNSIDFKDYLNETLELCHKALRARHLRLLGTKASYSSMLYSYGALTRLDPNDTIDSTLFNNQSTISLGYVGLFETCEALYGSSHYSTTDRNVHIAALDLIKYLRDKCTEWASKENISYSLYGTPEEATSQKFAEALKVFPLVKNVNDHDYVTNSYHVDIKEPMTAFQKIEYERKFQNLTPGGSISYIECGDLTDNPEALLKVVQYAYDRIMYMEFNRISSRCLQCGSEDTITMEPDGKRKTVNYQCRECGNTDRGKMHYAARVCGYISTSEFNYGRACDIRSRVVHLGSGDGVDLDEVH